MSFMWIKS